MVDNRPVIKRKVAVATEVKCSAGCRLIAENKQLVKVATRINQCGISLNEIDLIELNEAFASQSIAVIRELGLNPAKVNVNGGAIALGHPLGATGAKLTVQILNELKRRNARYGMVTMCVGTGQGAAGIFERF